MESLALISMERVTYQIILTNLQTRKGILHHQLSTRGHHFG